MLNWAAHKETTRPLILILIDFSQSNTLSCYWNHLTSLHGHPDQAVVVQRLGSIIHWINHCPRDTSIGLGSIPDLPVCKSSPHFGAKKCFSYFWVRILLKNLSFILEFSFRYGYTKKKLSWTFFISVSCISWERFFYQFSGCKRSTYTQVNTALNQWKGVYPLGSAI